MRQFQVSTPNLIEPAKIVYDDKGVLTSFTVAGTGMNDQQVFIFKKMVPVKVENIEAAFAEHKQITVVEMDFEVTFEMFWLAYDNKVNKKRSLSIWDKMTKSSQVKAWAGVASYKAFLKKKNWRSEADPDTYLRQEYWENEYK